MGLLEPESLDSERVMREAQGLPYCRCDDVMVSTVTPPLPTLSLPHSFRHRQIHFFSTSGSPACDARSLFQPSLYPAGSFQALPAARAPLATRTATRGAAATSPNANTRENTLPSSEAAHKRECR